MIARTNEYNKYNEQTDIRTNGKLSVHACRWSLTHILHSKNGFHFFWFALGLFEFF